MENRSFTTTVFAAQTPGEVFNVIKDVRMWWSGLFDESFEGTFEKVGDEFSFRAGGGVHITRQRLVELVPDKKLVWLVTDSNLSFVDTTDEWTRTKISFDITEESGRTKIVFTHIGLVPDFECYESCAPAWTQYICERLPRAIMQTTYCRISNNTYLNSN
ncbi:SRPBCC family protein [Desertivirga brevis]|uniref:SRPBCC family protein n=1 Tax=Desertivirga brevis TaxID=2810310 RepID=UPI001A973613|nr:SRPBCC domain-containing protein [Pedobacter sp. SYSU D00873]